MNLKMKYYILVLLLVLSAPAVAQSLFYADDKETFIKELQARSIPEIRKELADASAEMKDLMEQFKRLDGIFTIGDSKTYTEAKTVATAPYKLPDDKLTEERFNATVQALIFEQQLRLPDARFEISPPEGEHNRDYLNLNYNIHNLYQGGSSFKEGDAGLKRIDSLKATATYSIPTKMATVKIAAGQKSVTYRNAKIYLDALDKNQVRFRVDTAINDDLLEVLALTPGGKLVDHSGYRNSSNKNDGTLTKFMTQVVTFLDGSVADIDAHPSDTKDALTSRIAARLMQLQLPERSGVNYKEYEFKGNVQTLVLYFREDKRKFSKDITAYNKDKTANGYYTFSDAAGNQGLCDAAGKIVIPAQYKSLEKVNDNFYYVLNKSGRDTAFYLDRQAQKLLRVEGVDYLDDQGNGMVVSRRLIKEDTVDYDHEYKCALYNTQGKQVIPEQYVSLEVSGSVVFYQTVKDGKYGLLSLDGKKISEPEYDRIKAAVDVRTEERLPVVILQKDGHYGMMDGAGKLLCPLQYDAPITFSEGKAVVSQTKKDEELYGLIDKNGRELIPLQYDYISDYADGAAIYGKDQKYGLLNSEGKTITGAVYGWAGEISDGMVVVRDEKGKYGVLNAKGVLAVPFRFSEIKDFQAGYAFVFTEDQYGIIDETGKFMMQAPRPSSYGMSTNWKGKERTYQINGKNYNYKGDLIKDK